MNYNEYKSQFDKLNNELKALIDADASDQAYNAKVKEINDLNAKWDRISQRKADYAVLDDNRKSIRLEDYAVETSNNAVVLERMDMRTGATSYGNDGIAEDPRFLNKTDSMVSRVLADHPDQRDLVSKPGALGNTIRGIVTGRWDDNTLKDAITTTTGGVLIPSVLSAGIIDLMRNECLFTAAGVPVVQMEHGNLTIARVAQDPVMSFKAEGEEGVEGSMAFDSVNLKAKTAYGYAYLTLEAVRSAENLDSIVKNSFAQALARVIDKAMLYGQKADGADTFDDFAPAGIWNDTNVLSYTKDTDDTIYDALIKARAKIMKKNGTPSALAINTTADELMLLQKDSTLNYLPIPAALSNLDKVVSNQLNDGDALVFDPNALLIGMQSNINIEQWHDEKSLKRGLVCFRISAMLDACVIRPDSICKVALA